MMKMKLLLCLFLFAGCTSTEELAIEFQDLERDFPKSEVLVPEVKGNYELYDFPRSMIIKDSLIFIQENTPTNFGRCFHIESGKELANIVNKGNANYEMINVDNYRLWGSDSIAAISLSYYRSIKIYSIHNIISANHDGYRELRLPKDSITTSSFDCVGDNLFIGVPIFFDVKSDKKYCLMNGDSVTLFGSVNNQLFQSNTELTNEVMRSAHSLKFIYHNNKAVALSNGAMQLEIIDLKNCKVEKQRFYNQLKINVTKNNFSNITSVSSDMIGLMASCNDEHIYVICIDNSDPGKKGETSLLVFDWELNPVKRYVINEHLYPIYFTEKCDFLYALQASENEEYHTLLKYTL